MEEDVEKVDLLIVMGSSLQVGPVNSIPDAVPQSVPTILSKSELVPIFKKWVGVRKP